jgi:hypothetical protein
MAKTKTSQNQEPLPVLVGILDFQQLWLHSRCDARKRLDEGIGMAGVSGLPA